MTTTPTTPTRAPSDGQSVATVAARAPAAPIVRRVGVVGTGRCVPERVLTNHDLERIVDTSDEWIVTRTGMRERRIAAPGQTTSDLAIGAANQALEAAGLAGEDVELVLVATATPDHVCSPPTAGAVQHRLGAVRAGGFDVSAACSGFVNALMTGHRLLASGGYANALVIGAETLSRVVDYEDRESCVLFGDGAGAVVLRPDPSGGELIDHIVGLDGSGADLIVVPAGGSRRPTAQDTLDERLHYLRVEGRKVFKFAVTRMSELVTEILGRNGHTLDDVDLLIPHQANLRIVEAAAERLGIGMDRVAVNIERYGNTSSASVPMALDEAVRSGRLERGSLVCLVAFGGGLTWGASLLRW